AWLSLKRAPPMTSICASLKIAPPRIDDLLSSNTTLRNVDVTPPTRSPPPSLIEFPPRRVRSSSRVSSEESISSRRKLVGEARCRVPLRSTSAEVTTGRALAPLEDVYGPSLKVSV